MGIRALEAERQSDLVFQVGGVALPVPAEIGIEEIERHIRSEGRTLLDRRMTLGQCRSLLAAWLAHYGLGTARDVARAMFVVDRHEEHLTWDLRAFVGVDLTELWRRRQFRRLMLYIDHLPAHSHYNAAIVNDPEHVKGILEQQARLKASGELEEPKGPPLTTWTPEVAAIVRATDAIKAVQHQVLVSNWSDTKKQPPSAPKPEPRPHTLLSSQGKLFEHERRQAAHEALAARLVPHRRKT